MTSVGDYEIRGKKNILRKQCNLFFYRELVQPAKDASEGKFMSHKPMDIENGHVISKFVCTCNNFWPAELSTTSL